MQMLQGVLIRSLKDMDSAARGGQQAQLFRYIKKDKMIYTTLQIGRTTFKKELNLMLSWDLAGLIRGSLIN